MWLVPAESCTAPVRPTTATGAALQFNVPSPSSPPLPSPQQRTVVLGQSGAGMKGPRDEVDSPREARDRRVGRASSDAAAAELTVGVVSPASDRAVREARARV